MLKCEKSERLLKQYWRPTACYIYLLICIFDFIIFPLYFALLQPSFIDLIETIFNINDIEVQTVILQNYIHMQRWIPITMRDGGLFHMSFGAIIGISAYTRGKEKINRLEHPEIYDENTKDK